MNVLLVIFAALAIWRGFCGMKRGLADEVGRLISLVISLFVLSLFILLYTSIREKDTKNIVLSVAVILVTGLAARLLSLVMKSLSTIAGLPFISFFNKLAGAAIGIAEAVVGLWIVYVIVSAFDTGDFGRMIMTWTTESELLNRLYRMNQIAYWMAGL